MPLIVVAILLVMAVNLRGISESGTIVRAPDVHLHSAACCCWSRSASSRTPLGEPPQVDGRRRQRRSRLESMSLLLLMRAFADGCSAMTGTEAVANGAPAFKPPEWKNAQTTMLAMAAILRASMFLGISYLAGVTGAIPASDDSVLSQIAAAVFGGGARSTTSSCSRRWASSILAAQTSFADFPRLASILARDGFFPRQFAFRGERLAFNAGIIALAGVVDPRWSSRSRATSTALIPLYAIGVFTAFTLSQAGMVRHWLDRARAGLAPERRHQRRGRDRDRRSSRSSSPSRSSRSAPGS